MLFQCDTIHSDDYKSVLIMMTASLSLNQKNRGFPAQLHLYWRLQVQPSTRKKLFQLGSIDSDGCQSKLQQEHRTFIYQQPSYLRLEIQTSTRSKCCSYSSLLTVMTPNLSLNKKSGLCHPSSLDTHDCKAKPPQQKELFQLDSIDSDDCQSKLQQEHRTFTYQRPW